MRWSEGTSRFKNNGMGSPTRYTFFSELTVKEEFCETGKEKWINTSSKRVREQYYQNALAIEHNTSQIFKKAKVDHVNLNIQDGYIKQLMNLFKKR